MQQAIAHSYDLALSTQLAGERFRASLCPAGLGNSVGQGQSLGRSAGHTQKENGLRAAAGKRLERLREVQFFLPRKRRSIEDAAADGYYRRELAEDEAISGK